jgi:hypothetical protein
MVGRGIIYRGRSNAACGLRGGTVDCARQRAAWTRLGLGTHVPDGGHQGGIERRSSTSTAAAEQTNCRRAKHGGPSGRTRACPAKYLCAGELADADGSPRESRRADYCAKPNTEPFGVIGGGGAGRDRSTSCDAGTAGKLQRECLHGSLSFIPGSRLYLSAERWAAQALFKVSARPVAQPTSLFAARCRAIPAVLVCRTWHCRAAALKSI